MEKEASVFIIAILIASSFVMAVGSSSGGSSSNDNPSPAVTQQTATVTTCETATTLRERIKCRFENRDVAGAERYSVVEEACRGHNKTESCIQLYQRSRACYDAASPVAKKRCFLEKSGININAGGTFRAAPDETKRNYVVLLLYELQERIEEMQEDGELTADEAADLVAKIVEMKKDILTGTPRAEIVPKIQQFKQAYRTAAGLTTPTAFACSSNTDCELRTFNYCCGALVEGINRCYHVNELVQQTPTCTSESPCPSFSGPAPTSCECINTVCTGVSN